MMEPSTSVPKARMTWVIGTAGTELTENIVDRNYSPDDNGLVVIFFQLRCQQ